MAIGGGVGPRPGNAPRPAPRPTAPTTTTRAGNPSTHVGPRDTTRPAPRTDPIPDSVRVILNGLLAPYGLESMMDWAWARWKELGGAPSNAGDILKFEMTQRPEFKKRFPAFEAMALKGNAWSVDDILRYEKDTYALLHMVGLDTEYGHEKIQNFITSGVSYNELQQRVSMAQQAAQAPNSSLDAMKQLYGVDEKHLAGFFLDPTIMEPKLQTMWNSGQIGGAAKDQGFGDLSVSEAEMLARRGLDRNAADQGFGQLVSVKGLTDSQVAGEGAIDRTTQVGLVAGDAVAQEAFKNRQRSRTASFAGGAGFGAGRDGVTGLGSTS